MDYALSDGDIRQLLGSGIKITSVPDLDKVSSVNGLFDSKGRAIIFYPQTDESTGHWTCMIRRGKTIEFFDPYGEPPDYQTDSIPKPLLERLKMTEPRLAELLLNSGHRIHYNKEQIQELADDVQTCGRHCVVRLLFARLPIQKYRQHIKRTGMTPDEFVVKLTRDELGR
jgi:hypothetical protein